MKNWGHRGAFRQAICALALYSGCGESEAPTTSPLDADGGVDAGPATPSFCPVAASEDDRVRYAVVSHPYSPEGGDSEQYEVWTLSEEGELAWGGETFSLGRSIGGSISFRVDGSVGTLAHDDGTVGVFRLDAEGIPTVTHPNFGGDFRASKVMFDEQNPDRILVLDDRWPEYGGGLYALTLDCAASVVEVKKLTQSKFLSDLKWLDDERVVVSAQHVGDDTELNNVYVLRLQDSNVETLFSSRVFDDEFPQVDSIALSQDKRFVLIANHPSFGGYVPSIGVLAIDTDGLTPLDPVEAIRDPRTLVMSPFDQSGFFTSGFGDELVGLASGGDERPGYQAGESIAALPLPGHAVMINRGSLRGLVIVAENLGIHAVRFREGGVSDEGATKRDSGRENIVGAIGIQP